MKNLRFILPFVLFSSFSFGQSQVQKSSKIQPSQNTTESSEVSTNNEESAVEVRQTNHRIVKNEQVIVVKKSEPQEKEKEINIIATSNKREIE